MQPQDKGRARGKWNFKITDHYQETPVPVISQGQLDQSKGDSFGMGFAVAIMAAAFIGLIALLLAR